MSDSPTTPPFTGARFPRINWAEVLKALAWLLPVALALAMLYLRSEFATHGQVRAELAPLVSLPARVGSLEEHRARAEKAADATQVKFEIIQTQMAEVQALQREQNRNLDRILNRLDKLPPAN